jgi:hypothetical protein
MKKPLFSIIIPALNEAKYLPHLLQDLSSQTFKNFEVIVVDGNSRDQTVAITKTFKDKLPSLTILSSPKRHVCVQRNLGAKNAIADTLIFMDADNRLPPYFLQGVKYRHESEPTNLANFWFKPDKPSPSADLIALGINLATEIQNNIKPRFMLESMILVQREPFTRIGGFDETINYAEGINFISSAASLNFSIRTFRDPIYFYSFRRFRKFGNLNILRTTAQMGIAQLFDQDYKNINAKTLYPMVGGTLFNKPKSAKNKFIKNIQKIFKSF